MNNLKFTGNYKSDIFTNRAYISIETEGQKKELKGVANYKGIVAVVMKCLNKAITIKDSDGKMLVVNKTSLGNRIGEIRGLSEASITTILNQFNLAKKTNTYDQRPVSQEKASPNEEQNQPRNRALPSSISQSIEEHAQVNNNAPVNSPAEPEQAPPKNAVFSDYKILKKNYTQEELDHHLPLPKEEAAKVSGQPIVSKMLMDAIKSGKKEIIAHYSPKRMSSNEVNALLRDCVERQDRNGLRLLAQILFNPPSETEASSIRTLRELFFHPGLNELCIAKMMAKAFAEKKDNFHTPLATNRGESKNPPFENPQEVVKISHGGGLDNIRKFLNHETDGYQLEAGAAAGLQVSINVTERDESYAINGAWRNFDLPAIISADIDKKHLHRANIGFEGGLTSPNVASLKNVNIRLVDIPLVVNNLSTHNLERDFGEEIATAVSQSLKEFRDHNNLTEMPQKMNGLSISIFADSKLSENFLKNLDQLKAAALVNNRNVATAEQGTF